MLEYGITPRGRIAEVHAKYRVNYKVYSSLPFCMESLMTCVFAPATEFALSGAGR